MIASVGPLCGRSRRSDVRAKVWLNVSGWPVNAGVKNDVDRIGYSPVTQTRSSTISSATSACGVPTRHRQVDEP